MLDTRFKKIVLCTIVTALCGTAQVASAHTGIKNKVFIEGQGNTGLSLGATGLTTGISANAYNDFTITHGCSSNAIAEGAIGTPHKNVIAMAALFPNSVVPGETKIYRYKTGSATFSVSATTNLPTGVGVDGTVLTGVATTLPVTSPNDLTDDVNGAIAGAGLSTLGLGLVSPNLFGNAVTPITYTASGANPTARGYYTYLSAKSWGLKENIPGFSATGLSPFKFTAPTFKTTSCAANIIVRVAVSNWCSQAATGDDRKDVWIGTDTGSVLYSMTGPNAGIMPNGVSALGGTGATLANEQGNGKSFWPSFTIHRDLVANPLPASCNGESYDVVVQPSGADIDAKLAIPGYH